MQLVLDLLVPGIIAGVSCYGMAKKVDVYEALLQGGGQGAGDPPADPAGPGDAADRGGHAPGLRGPGSGGPGPGAGAGEGGHSPETVGLMVVRPISGSAALGVGSELITTYGPDSAVGRTAAVMLGSTETTFYTIAVYFGAAGIKRTRYAVPAALCADLAGFFFRQPHGAAVLRVSGNRGRIVVQWQASRAEAVASALRREILFQFLVELSDAAAPGQVLDGPNPRENRQVDQEVPQDAPQAVLHPVGQVGDGGAWPGSRSGNTPPSA